MATHKRRLTSILSAVINYDQPSASGNATILSMQMDSKCLDTKRRHLQDPVELLPVEIVPRCINTKAHVQIHERAHSLPPIWL
jgi:hypothetical protein